jgi:hypothetical protein
MEKLTQEIVQTIRQSEGFIAEVGKGTGWVPQPEDTRDYTLKMLLGSKLGAVPPPTASMRVHEPRIRDQGQQGACTGFGTANGVGVLVRRDPNTYWETEYSPQFIYNLARQAIGELHLDQGAYVRDAVGVVRNYGACRESDFKYYEVEQIQGTLPPERAFQSAKSWQLGAHYACHTLDEVRAALSNGYPVVFGFLCYSNLGALSTWDTGRILEPTSSTYLTGGHCVLATEYNDTERYVSGPNSWGSYWGDHGRYYLPYSYFEQGRVDDMWAMTEESPTTQYPNRAE